jgi:hypothetical protein
MTSNTKLEFSCKNVLLLMFDIRLIPLISEIEDRRDEPEIPNFERVPVGDFRVEPLSWGTVSWVGLSRPVDVSWWKPLVVPFVSSFRVLDLDRRFLIVPKIVVFFLSLPRSARLPVIGSTEGSFSCWIMLIFTFNELLLLVLIGFIGVEVTGCALADSVGEAVMWSYGYLLPFAMLMLWRCWLELLIGLKLFESCDGEVVLGDIELGFTFWKK